MKERSGEKEERKETSNLKDIMYSVIPFMGNILNGKYVCKCIGNFWKDDTQDQELYGEQVKEA